MKKFKLKKERKSFKVLVYTLFVFCAIVLSNYPKSYPKYIDSGNLSYNVSFYSLYKGEFADISLIKDGSTNTLAHFQFDFDRNNVVTDNTSDKYIIKLPEDNSCYFAPNGIKPASGGILANNTITYRSVAIGKNNLVDFYCNISFDETSDILNKITVVIEEQVTNKEQVFLYEKHITPAITKEKYYELIDYTEPVNPPEPEIIKDKVHLEVPDTKPTDEINKIFDDWIKEIDEILAGEIAPLEEKTITEYVNHYCQNDDVTKCNIPGIDLEHKDGKYIFTIQDNFVGYARTYNGKVLFDSRLLYFTTKDLDEIKEAYTYYFNNYYETINASDILAYIENNGGTEALINNKIPGLRVYVNNQDNIIIKIDNNIMGYVFPKAPERPYKITFARKSQMEKDFFNNNYIIKYYGDIVSSEAQEIIVNGSSDGEPYYSSVTKNYLKPSGESGYVSDNKSFTDYFVSYDPTNKHYLLINIYADIEKYPDNDFNTVDFTALKVPDENFKISFINDKLDETLLNITLIYNDKDILREVIDYLDKYFGVSTNINLDDYSKDLDNNITVEYSIRKEIIR